MSSKNKKVIARRQKTDVAIPSIQRIATPVLQSAADLLIQWLPAAATPQFCAHWLPMTCVI